MKKLFLDIETLPAGEESRGALEYLYGRKVAKKGKEWKGKEAAGESGRGEGDEAGMASGAADTGFEEYLRGTSFDGGFGRILCIGYAVDDEETRVMYHAGADGERETLKEFWALAKSCDLFVGHNILDFDLRFIYQRSAVLGVLPSRDISFARYRNSPVFDTMREWSKWGQGNIGLEHLALALGIPSPKDGIDGSQVFDFYQAGKVREICEYCRRDVETTRKIYKKMAFENF